MFGIEKLLEKILNRQNTPKEKREEFNIKTKYVHGLLFYNSYFDKLAGALSRDTVAFIVGGWIRDRLLNRPVGKKIDIDFVVTTDPFEIVKNFQKVVGGDIFKFEKETKVASIIFFEGDIKYRFDFSYMDISDILNSDLNFNEKELKIVDRLNENLLSRDFTINAMAIVFDDALGLGASQTVLFDPSGGLEDLQAGIIKPISYENIEKDPVRIIRGYRIAQEIDFDIDKDFEKWVKENKSILKNAPIERLRDEILKIFDKEKSYETLDKLLDKHILQEIVPEINEVLNEKESIEVLKNLENYLKKKKVL
ncbi:tRNA nucleotidyltransferase/poly(A) polymerase family protein [Hydrogenothermus marinus]|uniref:Poly(A) polymerase n=1 Tax=Hydrogenothermus marinus TaxID=133270 RepID=A0A3M0BKG4_9AQUI|nr:CCA tRNA nucleotidyltransferase [Hydrogenothermus marinus]RMA97106.1 poly(A) polymerase [Hydrogenothermus marinus]